jgi:predicted ATPase
MTRGYAAPEVIAAYGRALELCGQVGEGPQQLLALAGVYRFSLIRSELRTAHELAEQVLGFARRHELPLAFQTGHLMRGITSFGLGEFAAARDHLALAASLYDPSLRPMLAASFGDDPAVVCLAHTAMTLWFLGAPDQALARCEEALARARATGLPHGLVFALNYATWCRLLRREAAPARAHVDAMIAVASENEFAYWLAQGTAIRGWVLIDGGEVERGVAEIRRGLDAYEAIGAEVMRPWHLVRLAEAYGRMGRVEEGLAALAESFATMRSKDERFYEAELYRIEGELVLQSGDFERAAERFAAALDTARRQGSPALELRAALSHARLLRRQGRGAPELLAGLVGRFSEGFATGDLRDAQAVLAEA